MVQRLRNVSSKIEIVVDVPSCIYEFKFILLNTRCKVDKTKSIVRKKKNTSSSHHGMMEIISLNGINSISTNRKDVSIILSHQRKSTQKTIYFILYSYKSKLCHINFMHE